MGRRERDERWLLPTGFRSAGVVLVAAVPALVAVLLTWDTNGIDLGPPEPEAAAAKSVAVLGPTTDPGRVEATRDPQPPRQLVSRADAAHDARPGDFLDRPRERAGTERAYCREFSSLLSQDVQAFRKAIEKALAGNGPIAEKVAALRVWYDNKVDLALTPFASVLRDRQGVPELREFALRFLVRKSRHDAAARSVLASYLATHPRKPRHRAEAMFGVLRWGRDREVRDCMSLVYAEQDPGVLSRAAAALADSDLAVAREILDVLRYRHGSVSRK